MHVTDKGGSHCAATGFPVNHVRPRSHGMFSLSRPPATTGSKIYAQLAIPTTVLSPCIHERSKLKPTSCLPVPLLRIHKESAKEQVDAEPACKNEISFKTNCLVWFNIAGVRSSDSSRKYSECPLEVFFILYYINLNINYIIINIKIILCYIKEYFTTE